MSPWMDMKKRGRWPEVEQHYTVQETAGRLAVSVATVWRYIRKRKIAPVVKLERAVRIPASAIESFIEARRV